MNRGSAFTSALVLAALSLALPASAQDRRDGRRSGERAAASQPAPRQEGARAVPRGGRDERANRPSDNRPAAAPESRPSPPPQASRRGDDNRPAAAPEARPSAPPQASRRGDDNRDYQPRAVPRPYARPDYRESDRGSSHRDDDRYYSSRPYSSGRVYARPYSRLYVRPYNFVPYRPYYFGRPYYSFRPRLSIGFGLWLGDPVPYPYGYLGTYRPRVYGYYPGEYGPSVSVYGGLSFDIQPSDADLFVDGEYAGTVGTFGPYAEPLTLTPGVHRIAVQRDGFRAMEWDVTIQPGQVIPYRGDMEEY